MYHCKVQSEENNGKNERTTILECKKRKDTKRRNSKGQKEEIFGEHRRSMERDKERRFELEQEKEELEKLLRTLMRANKKVPEGTLRIIKTKGKYPQYYHYQSEEEKQGKNLRYLPKKELKFAQKLAQKQYDMDVMKCLGKRIDTIEKFLGQCKETDIEVIYEKLSEERKALVIPVIETDEMFESAWRESIRENTNEFPKEIELYTEAGECVRSKSEKILADGFRRMGIPYVYEPELELADGSRIYPDFALLHKRKRKTIYFEHFGMMDVPEYGIRAIKKIMKYEENGYWFGDNFLCTFETSENPLDMRIVEKMLKHYF